MLPNTEEELAGIIKDTAANGSGLRIQGGGTRSGLGNPVQSNSVLKTWNLSGVSLYEPGALTIVAQAGTLVSDIEAMLDAEGQMLAFEPLDHSALYGPTDGKPTIGGVVATNASGPRRIQAGACRDSLIGVRFVDGAGNIIKNGGRVMKNVTGYDLVKLMSGSYGTLGVLSEVSFKVLPKPEKSVTLVISGLDPYEAQEVLSDALRTPFDVTGAAYMGQNVELPYQLQAFIRLEGFENSIKYRARELKSIFESRYSGRVHFEDDCPVWSDIANFKIVPKTGDIWQISVKPTDGPDIMEILQPYSGCQYMDWAGGLVTVNVSSGFDIREKLTDYNAQALCLRGSGDTFHPEPTPIAKISAGLRAKFDPNGVLNPGIMG